MKHRNVNTLEGGENMQRTSLAKTIRYLVAVLAVFSVFALLGCSSDDDEEEAVFDLNGTPVAVSANTVAIAQGQAITVPNGAVFSSGIGNNSVALTFGAPNGNNTPFTLTRGTSTASGTTAFASCTFTVTTSNFPAGQGPQVGNVLSFPTCNFLVTANDVVQGGDTETGTITLVLVNAAGISTTGTLPATFVVNVSINANGVLIINNVTTPVDVDSGTATAGVTGG